MFCYFPAIDYSDGSMLEARSCLGSISSFIHDTQAYMKGQLQCAPVQEAFLWERYRHTNVRVCCLHCTLACWDNWCPPQVGWSQVQRVKSSGRRFWHCTSCQRCDEFSSSWKSTTSARFQGNPAWLFDPPRLLKLSFGGCNKMLLFLQFKWIAKREFLKSESGQQNNHRLGETTPVWSLYQMIRQMLIQYWWEHVHSIYNPQVQREILQK